ncbi:MAG: molybdopterin-guanine dinucleotide biosynthesis protein B [Rhodomicrobium sp.]
MTPLFGVVGWKNSGKTTLTAKLIANFAARGLEVAAIKHAHHGFDIDQEGRDSYRFREAGARTVALSSSRRVAIMTELRGKAEPTLEELAARVGPADLILVEGFKRESHPKLEVRRRDTLNQLPLAPNDPSILAIAADFPIKKGDLPVFDLNSVDEIAGFILGRIGFMKTELIRDRS